MQNSDAMMTIGVLGGMGPMATVNLAQEIVENTLAESDQQHPPMIIDSNTRIADRTAFLLNQSNNDPRPELIKAAKRLVNSGAGCIIMPCNTAHAFYDDIVESIAIPALHMIEETSRWITEKYPDEKKIGVLATQGTYSAKVYQNGLHKFGLKQVVPDTKGQIEVTKLIYDGIKANNYSYDFSDYKKTIIKLREENELSIIILGCTELSVAHKFHPIDGVFANPLKIIARAAIKKVGAKTIQE